MVVEEPSGPALPPALITVHEWLGTSLAVIFILLAIWRWRIQKRDAVPGVSYMVVLAIVALRWCTRAASAD